MLWTLGLSCVAALLVPPASNPRPIIGIVSQPNEGEGPGVLTYVPASYVKFLESAGCCLMDEERVAISRRSARTSYCLRCTRDRVAKLA